MVPEHPKNTGEHPWKKVQKSPKNLKKVIGKSLKNPEKVTLKLPLSSPGAGISMDYEPGVLPPGATSFRKLVFFSFICFLGCKILKKRFH